MAGSLPIMTHRLSVTDEGEFYPASPPEQQYTGKIHKSSQHRISGNHPSLNLHFGTKAYMLPTDAYQNDLLTELPCNRLTWFDKPKSVLVVRKLTDTDVQRPYVDLVKFLVLEMKLQVHTEPKSIEDIHGDLDSFIEGKTVNILTEEEHKSISSLVDFIVCLGGDGTLLYAASLFQHSVPPVLPFHHGSLGFLMQLDFANFREIVTKTLEGNAPMTLRHRLKCVIQDHTSTTPTETAGDHPRARHTQVNTHSVLPVLNEVVIDRGPSAYVTTLDLYVNGKFTTTVQGDGLIISTPTGSTAYAMSAGGSMVHPSVPAIQITPICVHSLSFRPLILPACADIMIKNNPSARAVAWMSFDGRDRQKLDCDTFLKVTMSPHPVPTVNNGDETKDYFNCLSDCLNWNTRVFQRPKNSGLSSPSGPDTS